MSRIKGSGNVGSVRSLRLPHELDAWFSDRLRERVDRTASELLLELVHAGLSLRDGYMRTHRNALESLKSSRQDVAYETYRRSLEDTFGADYVKNIETWLQPDGTVVSWETGKE